MKDPLISIIVPVYNVAVFLSKCLDSIKSQTIQDWECICVNDGSTDSSLGILEQYQNKDTRFKIISKPNGGLSSARNAGLKLAQSKYVAFVDSDDAIKPSFLEELLDHADSKTLDIVGCCYESFPDRVSSHYSFIKDSIVSGQELLATNLQVQSTNDLCFVWRYMFRKTFIEENNLVFDERVRIGEDMIFMMKAISVAKRIMLIDRPLYYYRIDNSSSLMREKKYRSFLEHDMNHIWNIKMDIAKKYHWDQYTPFSFDAAKYVLFKFWPMMVNNAKAKDSYSISDIKRILNLSVMKESMSIIGYKNIYLSYKEYVVYLAMKFNLASFVYKFV